MANPFRSSFVNRARYYVRLFWLPILCVALAGIGLNRADAADSDPPFTVTAASTGRPATPVFSVRRIPVSLVTPLQGSLLADQIRGTSQGLPNADSCQIVTNAALRVVYAHNPTTALIPASNQKILTAYTALTLFGVDKKFRTQVVSDAPIDRGIVSGDIFLVVAVLANTEEAPCHRLDGAQQGPLARLRAGRTHERGSVGSSGTAAAVGAGGVLPPTSKKV